jgi:hypothetical protein
MSDRDFGFEDDIRIPANDDNSDMSRVSELLLDSRFKRRKSNISERVISVLATLDTIAMKYDIDFLKQWIPAYLEYRTSKDGEARKQITDIAQSMLNQQNERFDRVLDIMGRR